jgi:lipopolysaccharide transport system ATP-binding protein
VAKNTCKIMEQPIIEVENLSKLYRLGVIGTTTLQESVERWWYRMRGKEEQVQKVGTKHLMIEPDDPQAGPEPNSIWALKDVSFSVQKAEIVGIIGKNGAGKSTLLKILTRITEPTSGRAIIEGRIASLLEVGTGFHPELTGRENVYLNGAILGMRKAEIDNKFDEIVDFSGIENFIDTPVKRYSSGMYVRLAFAVAAHLEPNILLVDEVLAVGDAEFQKKCLGKMKDVATGGRTVLFVSHNMAAVANLCSRAMLIESGRIVQNGAVPEVIESYLANMEAGRGINLDDRKDRFDGSRLRFTHVTLSDAKGRPADYLRSGDAGQIILHYRSPTRERFRNVFVRIYIESIWGQLLCGFETASVGANFAETGISGKFVCTIPRVPLQAGSYLLWIYVNAEGKALDEVRNAGSIEVVEGDFYGHGKNPSAGALLVEHSWQ